MAIVGEVESFVRNGLEHGVKRDPDFFDKGIQHVTDELAAHFERPLLELMVRRVMPKE